jgi:hypothetical protein
VNKSLILSADSVSIQGRYFTVSNGFMTKAEGVVQLRKKDLLSVEIVKHRSKKAMFAVLILGSILIFILSFIRANIGADNIIDIYDMARDTYELIRDGRDSGIYKQARAAVMAIMVFTGIITVFGAGYLFSGKKYVELTTMSGIYRVIMKRGDNEAKSVVLQLRGRL